MRINLKVSPNKEMIPYDHLPALAGTLHKWLGPNSEHNGLSLYSFSWLQNGIASKNGINFPNGTSWIVSAFNDDFLRRSIEGILKAPEIRWGMKVTELTIQMLPDFRDHDETRFLVNSPILVKRSVENGGEKHFLYTDTESDNLLTETLKRKLRAAQLDDSDISVRFDRDYHKAKTQLVKYRQINNRCSYCPVLIKGSAAQKSFAWTVGIGNSTGIGFGSLK